MALEMILVVLEMAPVVLHGAQRQRLEQMYGTDGVRNNVPSQLSEARFEPGASRELALLAAPQGKEAHYLPVPRQCGTRPLPVLSARGRCAEEAPLRRWAPALSGLGCVGSSY